MFLLSPVIPYFFLRHSSSPLFFFYDSLCFFFSLNFSFSPFLCPSLVRLLSIPSFCVSIFLSHSIYSSHLPLIQAISLSLSHHSFFFIILCLYRSPPSLLPSLSLFSFLSILSVFLLHSFLCYLFYFFLSTPFSIVLLSISSFISLSSTPCLSYTRFFLSFYFTFHAVSLPSILFLSPSPCLSSAPSFLSSYSFSDPIRSVFRPSSSYHYLRHFFCLSLFHPAHSFPLSRASPTFSDFHLIYYSLPLFLFPRPCSLFLSRSSRSVSRNLTPWEAKPRCRSQRSKIRSSSPNNRCFAVVLDR